MKKLILLACLLPLGAFAQTRTDYENTMTRFKRYYNNEQGDSIARMWRNVTSFNGWTPERMKELKAKYGVITSTQYFGIDPSDPGKVVVFKTTFSKTGAHAIGLSLRPDDIRYLGTFRLKTTSPEIERMMKADKEKGKER